MSVTHQDGYTAEKGPGKCRDKCTSPSLQMSLPHMEKLVPKLSSPMRWGQRMDKLFTLSLPGIKGRDLAWSCLPLFGSLFLLRATPDSACSTKFCSFLLQPVPQTPGLGPCPASSLSPKPRCLARWSCHPWAIRVQDTDESRSSLGRWTQS